MGQTWNSNAGRGGSQRKRCAGQGSRERDCSWKDMWEPGTANIKFGGDSTVSLYAAGILQMRGKKVDSGKKRDSCWEYVLEKMRGDVFRAQWRFKLFSLSVTSSVEWDNQTYFRVEFSNCHS